MPSAPRRPDPAPAARGPAAELAVEAKDAVLDWYARTGRSLAFRGTTDPYAILVSEAMAQQTQAARAAERWTAFLHRFPTVQALAAATPADVLRAWRGLGYNRRATALHAAARRIVAEHDGQVPSDLPALEALPGIGPYTARAVAAIAFGRSVGPVDTNVRRVLGRALFGDPSPPPRNLQAAADAAVEGVDAGTWTHAVMDVGARLCRPRRPLHDNCPLAPWCLVARAEAGAPGVAGPGPGDDRRRPSPSRDRRAPVRAHAPGAFPGTTRWLRGRILDRLRDADDEAWLAFTEPIGSHALDDVLASLRALARDGLVELRDVGAPRHVLEARLPLA